jgi:hypothetical protein
MRLTPAPLLTSMRPEGLSQRLAQGRGGPVLRTTWYDFLRHSPRPIIMAYST